MPKDYLIRFVISVTPPYFLNIVPPDHIETLEDSIVPWGYCTGGIYEYFVYHPSASPTTKAYITTQIRRCDLTPGFDSLQYL